MTGEVSSNPFDHLPALAFELPAFEDLTAEQQAALEAGPGWINDPAPIQEFEGIEDFKWTYEQYGSNNFHGFFERRGALAYVAETTPAFQRFQILHPELVEHLDAQMEALRGQAKEVMSDRLWGELLSAYRIMATLVDRSDRNYQKDGEDDPQALTR